jgi:hypothetical protein
MVRSSDRKGWWRVGSFVLSGIAALLLSLGTAGSLGLFHAGSPSAAAPGTIDSSRSRHAETHATRAGSTRSVISAPARFRVALPPSSADLVAALALLGLVGLAASTPARSVRVGRAVPRGPPSSW